mgnify:FL=1
MGYAVFRIEGKGQYVCLQAEVRAIMAQYMPLSDVDNKPNGV